MILTKKRLTELSDDIITTITTADGTPLERVSCYKYLGIWIDDKLSFKSHVAELLKKLKPLLAFFYRNKSCLPQYSRKQIVLATFLPVLDYGDVIYMHASPSTKPLDTVYHSAIRFVTGDGFMIHHCQLYQNVGWTSSTLRREQHCLLFIYRALLNQLPVYLTNLLAFRLSNYSIRTHTPLALNVPKVRTEVGKTAFEYFAPFKWNNLLSQLQLNALIPFNHFKHILVDFMHSECTCTF